MISKYFSKFNNHLSKVHEIKQVNDSIKFVITLGGSFSFPVSIITIISAIFNPGLKEQLGVFFYVIVGLFFILLNTFLVAVIFDRKTSFPTGFRVTAVSVFSQYKFRKSIRWLGSFFVILFNLAIIILLVRPLLDPPSHKFKILIANFEGPEPKKFRVTETIIDKLRKASVEVPDIIFEILDTTITTQSGQILKSSLLAKYHGDILVSGYYTVLTNNVILKLGLTINEDSELYSLKRYEQYVNEKNNLILPTSSLDKLEMQMNLAGDVTQLLFTLLSDYYFAKSEYDKSIHYLTKTIQLPNLLNEYSSKGNTYFARALNFEAKREIDSALADLRKAVTYEPKEPLVYTLFSRVFFNKFQNDSALYYIEKAIKLDSTSAGNYNVKGCILTRLKQYSKSVYNFNKSLNIDAKAKIVYLNIAYSYIAMGDYNSASLSYKKYLQFDKTKPMVYKNISNTFLAMGQYESAKYYLDEGIKLFPDYVELPIGKVEMLMYQGKYSDAIDIVNALMHKNKNNNSLQLLRGALYHNLKQYDSAIADLKKVFYSDNFESPNSYEYLFNSYFESSNSPDCIATYNYAQKHFAKYSVVSSPNIDSKNGEDKYRMILKEEIDTTKKEFHFSNYNLVKVARSFLELNENDSALNIYKSIEDSFKTDLWTTSNILTEMSMAYLNKYDLNNAYKYSLKATEICDTSYILYSNLCEVYKELKKYSKALEAVNKAIKLNEKATNVLTQRADLYEKYFLNTKLALDDLNKCVQIDPQYWSNYYYRANYFLDQNNIAEATKDINYLTGQGWDNYMIRILIGKYNMKLQNTSEALYWFNLSLQLKPRNYEALYMRGLVYMSKKNYKEAVNQFTKSLDIDSLSYLSYYQRGIANLRLLNYNLSYKDFIKASKRARNSNELNDIRLRIKEVSALLKSKTVKLL